MATLMLARRDFDGHPHYSHFFDDICDQLSLTPDDGKEINMIEIHVDKAKIDDQD